MRVRSTLLAVTLTGALAVLGACADKDQNSTGTPNAADPTSAAASVDAKKELADASAKLNTTSNTYTMKTEMGALGGLTGSGKSDPANKSSAGTMSVTASGQSITTEVVIVNTDMYLKMNMPLPGVDTSKWMHIDGTKVKSLSSLGMGDPSDPSNVKAFTDAIVTAEKTGTGAYKGTIDLTKSKAYSSGSQAQVLQQLGDAAKSVPFTATVNGDGYLESMTVTTPAGGQLPSMATSMKFADFGKAVSIAKPSAAQTQEAPAALYAQLGG